MGQGQMKALALAALMALSACQTGGGSFCDIARPMRPSQAAFDAMTAGEIADMLGHNEKGQRLCGWKP